MKRALAELLTTLGALAGLQVYLQLQDPTSRLRLALDRARDSTQETLIRVRVQRFIDTARRHSREG